MAKKPSRKKRKEQRRKSRHAEEHGLPKKDVEPPSKRASLPEVEASKRSSRGEDGEDVEGGDGESGPSDGAARAGAGSSKPVWERAWDRIAALPDLAKFGILMLGGLIFAWTFLREPETKRRPEPAAPAAPSRAPVVAEGGAAPVASGQPDGGEDAGGGADAAMDGGHDGGSAGGRG